MSDHIQIFVVYKRGMYGHGVHFASLNKDKAIESCKTCAKRDVDDYHEWVVLSVSIDTVSDEPEGFGDIVFSCNKGSIK